MTYGLTPRQKEALDFIKSFSERRGFSPSVREVQLALGLSSTSGVIRILDGLQQRGAIRRLPRCVRSIAIIEPGVRQ